LVEKINKRQIPRKISLKEKIKYKSKSRTITDREGIFLNYKATYCANEAP
jgi:hypothetical protein